MGKMWNWMIGRLGDIPPSIDPANLPPQEEINEDADENRLLAKVVYEQLTKSYDVAQQSNVEMSRWVNTSLLAVNAGGAVAMTQLTVAAGVKVVAGLAFVVGLILPLLGAYLAITAGWKLLGNLGGQVGYWYTVVHDGVRVRDKELEMNDLARQGAQAQVWPKRLSLLSIVAFVVGVGSAAYGTWIT